MDGAVVERGDTPTNRPPRGSRGPRSIHLVRSVAAPVKYEP